MSTKHTNGPWTQATYIIYASQSVKAEYPIHAEKRGLIAKAYRASDARLIAAAPELLAFAQAFLADYQSEDGMQSMKHYAKQAHAAISKATGEQA